jgi:PAS domain S-box-containing protein
LRFLRLIFDPLAGAVRLQGPLTCEPKAIGLHSLLLILLGCLGFHALIIVPLVADRKPANLMALAVMALFSSIALLLLRRGSLRTASVVYVASFWAVSSGIIVLNGGIRSPILMFYAALPISAAWLFGLRGTVAATGLCVASAAGLALMETFGWGPYWYFPGVPLAVMTAVTLSILIAAVPVMLIINALQDALAQAKLQQEAMRRERDVMSRVMETSPAGILVFDRDGLITYANASGAKVLGMTRGEVCRLGYYSTEWKVTTPDGLPLPAQERPFLRVKSRREAAYGMQMAVQPGDKRILLSVNAAPLVGADGAFDGAVITIEDITERRRVEEELQRHDERLEGLVEQRTTELVAALDQARVAHRSKMLFLANVSHELRTPLNAILGFSYLMRREEGLSAKQMEGLEIINRSGSELSAWIDDILEIARLETGHGRLEITTVDLVELVREVMKITRASADEKRLDLTSEWSGVRVRLIRVDALKLRQILINLVGNAIRYTDAGSIVLRVDAAQVDTAPGDPARMRRLRIEVVDTGVGIAPEDKDRIFEPFVQLSQPNTREGSGLGLAICRKFVRMMGGTIQVESTPGRGSTFRIGLTVEVAKGSPGVRILEQDEPLVSIAPGQGEFRVLLIQNDRANSQLLKRLLESAGFRVRVAEDGRAGYDVFTEWRPQFIWVDIQLQGSNGLEVTARLRELPGGLAVKIAVLTGGGFGTEHDAVRLGIDELVRKPPAPKTVFGCMKRLLGVQYIRPAPPENPVPEPQARGMAGIAGLPEDLNQQLMEAVLMLDKGRITEAIRAISLVDPALGNELTRHAEAFEFTSILRALRAEQPA